VDVRRYVLGVAACVWVAGAIAANVWAAWLRLGLHHGHGIARIAVGTAFAVTAVLLTNEPGQRGTARLCYALSLAWIADQAGLRDIGPLDPWSFVIGGWVSVLGCAILLRYPRDHLDRMEQAFVAAFALLAAGFQMSLLVTGAAPWDRLGPDELPQGLPHQESFESLVRAKGICLAVVFVLFLALLVRHWHALTRLDRLVVAPIIATTAAVGLLSAANAVSGATHAPWAHWLAEIRGYSVALLAFAFAWSALRLRLAVARVSGELSSLPAPVTGESVQDALRRCLGDDRLEVLFWVPESKLYVDVAGRAAVEQHESGRRTYFIPDRMGTPLARLIVDPALERHELLLSAAARVGGMALENARLGASLRTQLMAVRDARSRLLQSGMAQRRQLERDLHDGAQQRLLALGMRLSLIESSSSDPATIAAVQEARDQLHAASEELRDLAHGLYPAVLTQGGLVPAIEEVAARLPVVVEINSWAPRWSPDCEGVLFFVACEALTNAVKHAGTCRIVVEAFELEGDAVLVVADDGVGFAASESPGALRGLRDRLDGLGGTLVLTSAPGNGTRVEARVPHSAGWQDSPT
jgi:signal transduction histidine kinase